MQRICSRNVNCTLIKKTTARKIVIRLRNLVDGYYIPFGIASITIGIGLFIFYQTLTYSFKTIEGAFHNFVALQFYMCGNMLDDKKRIWQRGA